MRRRRTASPLRGKSATDWTARGIAAIFAIFIAYFSVLSSTAAVAVRANPLQAHALAPWDGAVAAAAAQAVFAAEPVAAPSSRAAILAREAILSDATASDAFTVLGFQSDLRGDRASTRRLFSYSLSISRRELRPRLWSVEEAVRRGDIRAALNNYDIALRTSPDATGILFPILTSALVQPRVRMHLHELLQRQPAWQRDFIAFAARNTKSPQAVAQFFTEGASRRMPVESGDQAAVVNSLASREMFPEAWEHYGRFRQGVTPGASRDEKFLLDENEPSVFDWVAVNLDGRSVTFAQGEGGADFSAPPSVSGAVLRQLQVLPAGMYRLAGESEGVDQPERSRPYWSLTCQNGVELGRVPVPNSTSSPSRFEGFFTVPPACTVQTLALQLRPSDLIGGVEGRIRNARLVLASDSRSGA